MKKVSSEIRCNGQVADLSTNTHLSFAQEHSIELGSFEAQLDAVQAGAEGDAASKATFAAAVLGSLCARDMVKDRGWKTLSTDELGDWSQMFREDYLKRCAGSFARLDAMGTQSQVSWLEALTAVLAPFLALAHEDESSVFQLECPLTDDAGYDAWWEAVDETLHEFF
ncbi:MAG: hypothetical protein KUG77_23765, partial [Nannocystaceae bacterium]|nr:hypothetical protein [Nannocystaceae bacterium]